MDCFLNNMSQKRYLSIFMVKIQITLFVKWTLNELEMLGAQNQPSFVFLIGDYLAHGYKEKYTLYSEDSPFK
ncbi:hypothetical protein B1F79_04160 [Coxiella-like endosymbiont of Rhipicephalus sanguineus]|nr:hypothetical protein [Coxiella-like endosymbiont of Rhipicephalus sanguineus]